MGGVIHRCGVTTCPFGSLLHPKTLRIALQVTKKPAVTRTSGRVMGEMTIWLSNWVLPSPTFGVLIVGTELHCTMSEFCICWNF